MTAFNLSAIMDAIAAALVAGSVVDTSKMKAYPDPNPTPPCGYVGYPEPEINFDLVFKRGADEVSFPVWILTGRVVDKSARDVLSALIDGTNAVKVALESDPTLGGVVASTRVVNCKIGPYLIAEVPYLGAKFDVNVIT